MATRRNIFKWRFQNISPGETNPEKRVDADRIMDNFDVLASMISTPELEGSNADDGNSNGDSTTLQCNLTVKSELLTTGVLEDNDWVYVTDGTNEWFLQNTVADDELSFSDSDLVLGSGTADYSDATFIDSLIIKVMKFVDKRGKSGMILDGTHSDGFTAADLQVSGTDTTKIGTAFVDTKETVDNVTIGSGSAAIIADEKVQAASLKKIGTDAVFAGDSPRNLSRGMFDNILYSNDILYGLQKTPAPANSYSAETTIIKAGIYSQYIGTNGSAQGIEILLDELVDMTLLAGKKMTLVAWIYSTENNALDIGFYDDGDGYQVSNATYTRDGWHLVHITKTIGTTATEIRGVIRSANAVSTDHYVDIAGIYIGETAFDPTAPSVYASIVNNALDSRFYNYIPMSDLSKTAWLNGTTEAPFPWTGTGNSAVDNLDFYTGRRSWKIDLRVGEYFQHYIGIETVGIIAPIPLVECLGKSTTFAFWLKTDGLNTEDLDLIIEEFTTGWSTIASGSFDVNSYADWGQVAVTGEISSSATSVRVAIKNNGSASITAKIDALMFTQTTYPIAYTSLTPWQYHCERFGLAGSLADGLMESNGIACEVPVGVNMTAYGMTITEQTSGTGTDSFYPKVNLVSESSLQIDLGNGETFESMFDYAGVNIDEGDTLGVYCDAAGFGNGSGASAVIHCLIWGI